MEGGKSVHSPFLSLRFIKIANLGPVRVSATVPQKIAKKAVERNHLRRLMYEALAPVYGGIVPNTLVVVLIKAEAVGCKLSILKERMKEVFVKAGLLK